MSRRAALRAVRATLVAAFAAVVGACVHTAPFRDVDGRVVPGSVATMETIVLGGVEQSVWIRGADRTRPLLVLLHGGPGASESALFRHFDAALERDFVVVYWEQRGTGRSFASDLDPRSMTIARLLRDLDELIDAMRTRFGVDRVVLLAHSWGTVLGTRYAHACPAKVAAYVGTGQIVRKRDADVMARDFALRSATSRGDDGVVARLVRFDPVRPGVDGLFALAHDVERYGGVFHAPLSTPRLLLAALLTDEADVTDLVRFGRGNRFSHEALLDEFLAVDATPLRRFDVPVVLLLGRHDMLTPSALAADWFATLEAPGKRLVWFERSAHNPPFEEPATFVAAVRDTIAELPAAAASPRCDLR